MIQNKKLNFLIVLAFLVVGLFFYFQTSDVNIGDVVKIDESQSENLLGGDRDEFGCIPSAGYSWCEIKQKCLRVWEEPCEESKDPILDNTEKPADINTEGKILVNGDKNVCIANRGEWFEESKICEINSFDENMCIKKGGEWNPCNSACRHDKNAEMCTMQCVLTCSFR